MPFDFNEKIYFDIFYDFNENKDCIKDRLNELFDSDKLVISHDSYGKPMINMDDLNITISHKNNLICFCVFSSDLLIGIDLENSNQEINYSLIEKHALTKKESDILSQISFLNKELYVLLGWSLKESYSKYIGRVYSPKSYEIYTYEKDNDSIYRIKHKLHEKYKIAYASFFYKDDILLTFCVDNLDELKNLRTLISKKINNL